MDGRSAAQQSPKMGKGYKRRKFKTRNYIKEWREYRGLSQEYLAARVESTGASISRLERGKQPYNQPILEALAEALSCTPADLIMRPPGAADELRAVWETLSADSQKRAVAIVKALKDSEAA